MGRFTQGTEDVSLDEKACSQLNEAPSELLDTIDSLRGVVRLNEMPLPQLIVIGNQNCGKSSVLESISRVNFGVNGFVCTRFPTELALRRASETHVQVSIKRQHSDEQSSEPQPSFSRRNFDAEKLPDLIREAETAMGIRDAVGFVRGFSDDILHIEVHGPTLPNLTLVDLPGLFESANKEQTEDDKAHVERIVEKYMADERSIILVVVGGHDPSTHAGPRLARKFDKEGKRTLGILTRIDSLEPGPDQELCLKCVKNDYIHFSHGWHALRNRTAKEREDNISNEERDALEREFFSRSPWNEVPDKDKGAHSLRLKLSEHLLRIIQENLSTVIEDVNEVRRRRITEKDDLGVPLRSYREQRNFISAMAKEYQELTERALSGKYDHSMFGYLGDESRQSQESRLLSQIRERSRLFGELLSTAGRTFEVRQSHDTVESEQTSCGTSVDNKRQGGNTQSSANQRAKVIEAEESRAKPEDDSNVPTPSDRSSILGGDRSSNLFALNNRRFHCGKISPGHGMSETFLSIETVRQFYTHPRPTLVTRESMDRSVLEFVATWRGMEGHGDTNTALTKEIFKRQALAWEGIVKAHADALWQACKRFVDLALAQTVNITVRHRVKDKIIRPAMRRLQKEFFAKRDEILVSHQNVDPSGFDGYMDHRALASRSHESAERLGKWAKRSKASADAEAFHANVYTNAPVAMAEFSAARSIDLATACLETVTMSLASTFQIMAVENCLYTGLRNLFTEETIGKQSESLISAVVGDMPDVAARREQLSREIDVTTRGLKVLRQNRNCTVADSDESDAPDDLCGTERDDESQGQESD
ncbi:hypothetical protein Purlil1_12616 [Purpureocillium lilacinum]|uniref:Dynamin family protein n=1 Tax=Purpureocillium lilacinum TaxID=33203 RepID=A0ABR0BGT8_PURLI|nr:hypothetical protein Purlil1_12616 [Purpureocillium lilacinum]